MSSSPNAPNVSTAAAKLRPAAGRSTLRFRLPYRQAIKRLTQGEPRLEDLAASFPALLFALATGFGTADARAHTLSLIDQGATLKSAAQALGIPWWMRGLPPETFAEPLHGLLDGPDVQRRIINYIPADGAFLQAWLRSVSLAHAIAGSEFALWLASRLKVRPRTGDRLVPLAAWAWYSAHCETYGHSLVRVPFEPAMSLKAAIEEADTWRKRIDLAAAVGDGIADTWFAAGEHGGLSFLPLRTAEDFIREAGVMDNCLDQFGAKLVRQSTRVFSIRRGEQAIADIEIAPHEHDGGMPIIEQLRGASNRRVSADVWQAAYGWLAKQTPRTLTATPVATRRFLHLRREIWQPLLRSLSEGPALTAVKDHMRSHDLSDIG